MIKEEKSTQEITIRKKYCDYCGEEIKNFSSICYSTGGKCQICGKDVCENCIGNQEEDSFGGDYITTHCKNCWSVGEPYRLEIKKLEETIEELEDKWISECKK